MAGDEWLVLLNCGFWLGVQRNLSLELIRFWYDATAFFARSKLFVPIELSVHLTHRIITIIADLHVRFVNLLAAILTEPHETIFLCGSADAFKYQEPGVFRYARRMRHAPGAEGHLTRT